MVSQELWTARADRVTASNHLLRETGPVSRRAPSAAVKRQPGTAHAVTPRSPLDNPVAVESIARLRSRPSIPRKDAIRRFVFDVATGKLNEVF
jgi:hypothetical protein